METIPTTSRSLDRYYHINGDTFEKQYKEVLSGYREWSELSHAEDWLVFPENIGESICIDETAPSNGELYTIVSNRSSHGGKGTIIAIVKGVAADIVTEALMRIDEDKRLMVKEITMDMSNSMRLIARRCFPNAMRTIDRFLVIESATYIYRNLHVMPCRRCASRIDGMPFKQTRMQEKRPNVWVKHTLQLCLQMVTPTSSCWLAADICFSNLPTNGQKVRDKELRYYLKRILILKKPIRLHIH